MFKRALFSELIAVSLTLVLVGNANGTERPRPLKLRGVATVVELGVRVDDEGRLVIPWELSGEGEGTYVGHYNVEAAGVVTIDPATGQMTNQSSGTLTAANGDTLEFEGEFVDASTVLIRFLGSTGRFRDAEEAATQSLELVGRPRPAAPADPPNRHGADAAGKDQ